MYSRIVCAIDGSDLSNKALNQAFVLASRLGAELIAVTVTDPSVIIAPGADMMMVDMSSVIADLDKAKAQGAKQILDEAARLAEEAGIPLTTLYVPGLPAAEGIIKCANERGADLIVMGSHGRRGLGRLLLGSQASEVLAHADIPVLVVK